MTTHHVIVGGSAAGVAAAVSMRSHGFGGRITLVDAGADLPYERPPLSKSFDGLDIPRPIIPATTYDEHDIALRLGATVTHLDARSRVVTLDDQERIVADAVLLATGVSARRLGVPGEDLANVLVLRDIHDARAVAGRLDVGGPLVLLGGGFIGLEAAAVARSRGLEVTVVEAAPVPLEAVLGHPLAQLVQRLHLDHGVRFHTDRSAIALHGSGSVEEVELDNGTRLPAATVLVGCGVVPNDTLARDAGVYTSGGLVVDGRGRTSNPWIWGAGDVSNYVSPYTRRRQRIEHWDVAQRHGSAVGANLAGARTGPAEAPYFWSDQFGHRLQMFGRSGGDDRLLLRDGATPDNFLAFWVRGSHRVVAAAGMDAAKEVRASKPLIEGRIHVDPSALLDPSANLRSLSRARVQVG